MLTTAQKLHLNTPVVVQPVTVARYCLIVPVREAITLITPHSGPYPHLRSSAWFVLIDETGPIPVSGAGPFLLLSTFPTAAGTLHLRRFCRWRRGRGRALLSCIRPPFPHPLLHLVELRLLFRSQHRPNPRLFPLVQRHHLRSPVLRSQRFVRPYRLHLRLRLLEDLPNLRRLAVVQLQTPLQHLHAMLRIHAPPALHWSLHLTVRRWPLLLIRRRWRSRLLLRYRRAHRQPGTTQHNRCRAKHPVLCKVLHRLTCSRSIAPHLFAALLSPVQTRFLGKCSSIFSIFFR